MLNTKTLLHSNVPYFKYNRKSVKVGVIHLGPGRFHRAHQASYFEDALERGEINWGILGVNFQDPQKAQYARKQNGLYTLTECSPNGKHTRIIGALKMLLFAQTQYHKILQYSAHSAIHIITLTITEKAYTIPTNTFHPLRFLVDILALRKKKNQHPPTIISCDNIPQNGNTLRSLILETAEEKDIGLVHWIERNVAIPNTVVDRIVPQQQKTETEYITSILAGAHDFLSVFTESHRTWIMEDTFSSLRPNFEESGVLFTSNLMPYYALKLRVFNAIHLALALSGLLYGHTDVKEALQNVLLNRFVHILAKKLILPTLNDLSLINVDTYLHELFARLHNPALSHALSTIAKDAEIKISIRFGATLLHVLQNNIASLTPLAFILATWIQLIQEKSKYISYEYPIAQYNKKELVHYFCTRLAQQHSPQFLHASLQKETMNLLTLLNTQGIEYTLQSII